MTVAIWENSSNLFHNIPNKMKIEEVAVEKLIPYERNNKIHGEEQVNRIANSIKEFWFLQPIVIDKSNIVIVWHWRLEWAKKLWLENVPCIRAENLTEKQIKQYRILDNKLNESEYDLANLKSELDSIWDFNIWDLEISVSDLFPEMETPEFDENEFWWWNFQNKEIEEDEVPAVKSAKAVKRWDIFELWWHRLMCWDSTSESDVMLLMWDQRADISFTSPPYNVWKNAKLNAWMRWDDSKYSNDDDDKNEEEYRQFLETFTKLSLEYSEYSFVNIQSLAWNKTALIDYLYDMKDQYADTIIRDKWRTAPAMWENVLNSSFEYVHVFSHKWNRAIWTIPFRWTLQNIFHVNWQTKNDFSKIHSATFPIEFAEHFIKNFAKNSVIDLFWWTWTSMIVAEQLWKRSFTMEIDPLYCEVCIKRFHKLRPDVEIKCTNREINIADILIDDE